jgi:hypothetical protein
MTVEMHVLVRIVYFDTLIDGYQHFGNIANSLTDYTVL